MAIEQTEGVRQRNTDAVLDFDLVSLMNDEAQARTTLARLNQGQMTSTNEMERKTFLEFVPIDALLKSDNLSFTADDNKGDSQGFKSKLGGGGSPDSVKYLDDLNEEVKQGNKAAEREFDDYLKRIECNSNYAYFVYKDMLALNKDLISKCFPNGEPKPAFAVDRIREQEELKRLNDPLEKKAQAFASDFFRLNRDFMLRNKVFDCVLNKFFEDGFVEGAANGGYDDGMDFVRRGSHHLNNLFRNDPNLNGTSVIVGSDYYDWDAVRIAVAKKGWEKDQAVVLSPGDFDILLKKADRLRKSRSK